LCIFANVVGFVELQLTWRH